MHGSTINRENKLEARGDRPGLEKSKLAISCRIVGLLETEIIYATKGSSGIATFIREIGLR